MSLPSANIRAFARFALVGALFALLNVLLLALLVSRFGLHYLVACTLSFFVLNFLSYLLNKTFTFRLQRQVVVREIGRYYAVMAASLALNLLLMYLLVDLLSLHYLLASAVVVIALSVPNFLGHAAFSFRPAAGKRQSCTYDVLQVSAFFPEHGGGIEVVAGHLATAWANEGLRVAWCAGEHSSGIASSSPDTVIRFPARYWDFLEKRIGLPFPIWYPSSIVAMWRIMRQSRVVQLHDVLYVPCVLAMVFARVQRKPVVLTQHIGELPIRNALARGTVGIANRTLGKWMLARADQAVFIASPVQAYFSRFVRFKTPPRMIANGVDHEVFHPLPQEMRDATYIRLLFVGRFVEKKGIHLLRSSLNLPGSCWTFAGWGPLDPAQWPDLPPTVTLAGHATTDQLVPLYQHADLLVLPSIGEGFPLVVQEALACGTPVLVSREVAETCPERDPACIFDVDVSDPYAEQRVHDTLARLVANPGLLHVARIPAARLAKQWSWDKCATAYGELYARISASSHSANRNSQ